MTTNREALVRLLEKVVRQNGNDMLLTGEELRECETAIAALSAQGGEQTADTQHARDKDWILAMGHALGLNSGVNVPIAPEAEPFKKLFAEIRERQAADTVSVPRHLLERWAGHFESCDGDFSPKHEIERLLAAAKEGKL